ncbi:MAG: ArsR family transcriptional regulator [Chloroflexi bacterium]|nr:MAG: ArsR family transcriptional regulator [Chloroflexota bacterium]
MPDLLRDPSTRSTSSASRAAASWAGRQGERVTLTVDEIPAHFPRVSRAAVSKHLRVLREARLVRRRHN